MIRALLTLAAPVAVATLAVGPLAGAGLLFGPAGEPMLVAANHAPLHKVSFDGCAPAIAKAMPNLAEGARIVAFALHESDAGVSVAIRELPEGSSLAGVNLVVVLDAAGRVLFAGDAAGLAADCGSAGHPKPGAI